MRAAGGGDRQAAHPGILALPYDQAIEHAVATIARVRTSPEGQAGLGAFLAKQKAPWIE